MIKSLRQILLAIILISFFSASLSLAAETRLVQSAYTSGKVVMTLAEAPLKTMTEIPFSIVITDAQGNSVNDAKLAIAMDMPAMPMPANNPAAEWIDGAYRGKAIFTMAGAWQITVDMQQTTLGNDQVVFDIEQVMMK